MPRILSSPRGNAQTAGKAVNANLSGKRDWWGLVFQTILGLALVVALLVLIALIASLIVDGGAKVLSDRGADFLTSDLSSDPTEAGIRQAIIGTFLIAVIVALVAFPLGIAAAVYLEEYAKKTRFAHFTQVNVRNLAGVPSVVYGILGLAVFVRALDGFTGGTSVIAGGLTLAVLVLPIVVITTSEALRAVPAGIREGSLAVGATQWETVRSHVLPAAAPGVLTGVVLSIARAAGEAAPLLLVGAVTGFFSTGDQNLVEQLRGSYTTMPIVIFSFTRNAQAEFRELAAAASLVLVVIILILNAFAIWLRNKYETRW